MSKKIITEIIEDLENTVGLNWSKIRYAKINKNTLIECWSEYRKDPDYKYFKYACRSSIFTQYKKIFSNISKNNTQQWKTFILNKYDYKYCYNCETLLKSNKFNKDARAMDNIQPKCKDCDSSYAEHNKKEIQLKSKVYREKNKEKLNAGKAKWKVENKDKVNNNCAKRRADKIQRTPAWLTKEDDFFFEEIYSLAQLRTELTDIKWHVDHIIPLQGKLVSGLHVPSNLQVITAKENLAKSNTFSVE